MILEFIDIFPEHVDGINVFELRIENSEVRIEGHGGKDKVRRL